MKTRLLASALLAASLIGAPAIAFAQTSPPPDNTGPSGAGLAQPAPKKPMHHAMKSTHMKKGTTTGMSSSSSHKGSKSTSQKPSSY